MSPTRSVEDVLALIDARLVALPSEEIVVADALDRVLAADAVATIDFPPADRAIVDGFALRSDETVGASSYNPLPFRIATRPGTLPVKTAVHVRAGEALPPEADCVVPSEFAQAAAGSVEITETVAPESDIERRSSHFTRGALLRGGGRRLRSPDLALLATAGIQRVAVVRRPRVVLVMVAGAEEADASILRSLIERDGGAVVGVNHVERTALRQACAAAADLVLLLSGPSRGRNLEAAAAFAECGTLDVAEVALSPGGSIVIGTAAEAWLLALPSAPVACFWAYEIVTGRAVRRLAGRGPAMPFRQARMPLTKKIVSTIGVTEIYPVRRQEGGAEPLSGYGPSNLLVLGRADGFVLVAEGSEGMPAGAVVPVWLFEDDAARTPDQAK